MVVSALVLTFTSFAQAGHDHCTDHVAGKVSLTSCHDWMVRDTTREANMPGLALGLEALRGRLVDARLIEDFPVHVQISNDAAGIMKLQGRYGIYVSDDSYDHLRALFLGLQHANAESWAPKGYPSLLRRGRKITGIEVEPSPHASPDGALVVQPVWLDGRLRYQLRTDARAWVRAIPAPRGKIAAPPVWAADGEHFAVASLREVIVIKKNGLVLRRRAIGRTQNVKIGFDSDGQQLAVSHADRAVHRGRTLSIDLHAFRAWQCSATNYFRHHNPCPSLWNVDADYVATHAAADMSFGILTVPPATVPGC